MRDILFRGKRFDNNEWLEGYYCTKGGTHFIIIIGQYASGKYYFTDCIVNPKTIGQYTCMVDKNGRRIFEGDIIKYKLLCNDDGIGPVIFSDQCFMPLTFCKSEDIEIIGNIHDNPELLKE